MSRLVENRLYGPPPTIQLTPVTETARLNFIQQCPDLIAHRTDVDPFKTPFLDRVKTDPFTGTVFIREGEDWFECETIEQSIHFMADRLLKEQKEDVLINTLMIHNRLSVVFSLLGINQIDDVKKLTIDVLQKQGIINNESKRPVIGSLGQSIKDSQSVVTNFLRYLNTVYKQVLAKETNNYSPILIALLLERSMERYCLEQTLLVLELFNVTDSNPEDLNIAEGLLRLKAVLTSPYRQAMAFTQTQIFGKSKEGDEEETIKCLIESLSKRYQGNITLYTQSLVDFLTVPTWKAYIERITQILKYPISIIKDALEQGKKDLDLPVM